MSAKPRLSFIQKGLNLWSRRRHPMIAFRDRRAWAIAAVRRVGDALASDELPDQGNRDRFGERKTRF
jgi:hypothetical protein